MSEMRDRFVERFGEPDAVAIERAADSHKNGIHDKCGSDPFRWALLICIGADCMKLKSYREYHGIVSPWDALDAWMKEDTQRASFGAHDGEFDYLAMFAGTYNDYMPTSKEVAPGTSK